MPRHLFPRALLGTLVTMLAACSGSDGLTAREVYTIVDEVDIAVRAEVLLEPTVMLATQAAMGAATPDEAATLVADALEQVSTCVVVGRLGTTGLTLDYTATSLYDNCQTGSDVRGWLLPTSGHETIRFLQADGTSATIDHTWEAMSNGYLRVDGTAHVTLSKTEQSTTEHMVNSLSWVRASDGKSGHGKDERTSPWAVSLGQQLLPTGLRTWESDAGAWEMRPVDARLQSISTGVPFIGTFSILTPEKLALKLSVAYGATGPRMTLTDGTHSYSFGLSPNGGTPTE